jgi:hypothetical protein
MDRDNKQIFHWLTAVGLGEYVQVFIGETIWLKNHAKEANSRNKQPNIIHRLTNTVTRLAGK